MAVRNAFKVANSNSKGRSKGVSFRVPVLYGEAEANGESAVNCLVDAVRKAQERVVRMEGWARRVPTNVGDVGRVLADTATLYLSTSPADSLPEILQFSSEDVMTKWEICEVFADLLGVGMGKMVPDIPKIGEGSGAVQRPYDCHLSTDELKKLGIDVSTVNFRDWWRGYLKREKGEAAA